MITSWRRRKQSLPEEFTKAYDDVVDRGEAPLIQIALAGLQRTI